MAVEDGYNVERSVLGQNDANNEQDTSLVTPNADGSAVERLEYIQTLLAALDTATLKTLVEAIQGTGFSDVTDSLKVLSDVLDTMTGTGFNTATDSLKILSDVLDAIQGAGFATGTDSLKVLSDVLDLIKTETDKIGTVVNTGGTAKIADIFGDFANVALVTKLANLQTEVNKIATPTDVVKRLTGKTQVFKANITSAANAGSVTVGTITTKGCLIEKIILKSNGATTADLTSAAIKGGAGAVHEFITAAEATQANLDAEDKAVISVVADVTALDETKTIIIDLQGTGATAVDFDVIIEYKAIEDGGYIA